MISSGSTGSTGSKDAADVVPSKEEVERFLALKAYIKLAWQLSKEQNLESELTKEKKPESELKKNIKSLDSKTRNALKILSSMLAATVADPTKKPLSEDEIRFLEEDTLQPGVSKEQQVFNFFKNHLLIYETLRHDPEILNGFEVGYTKFKRYSDMANTISGVADFVTQSSYSNYAKIFPPVFLVMIFVGGVGMLAGSVLKFLAAREDLDFSHKKEGQIKAFIRIILSISAILAFSLSIGLAGPIVIGSISVFMSLYALTTSGMHLLSFFKSAFELFKERKRKKNESLEAYKYRITNKSMKCIKYLSDAVFYLGVTLVWGFTFVLLVNPIALKAIAVLSFITSIVSISCMAAMGVEAWTAHKMKQSIDRLGVFDRAHTVVLDRAHSFSDQVVADKVPKKTLMDVNQASAGLFLLRKSQWGFNQLQLLMRPLEKMSNQSYFKQHEMAIKQIGHLQKEGSIYDDIRYDPINTSDHSLGSHAPPELCVKIPHIKNEAYGELGPDALKKDVITRHCDLENNVRMGLNADASDRALYLFFQLHQGFGTLVMDPCGRPELALKVMEAAKLMNVKVKLHRKDQTLFDNPDNQALKAQLDRLQQMPAKTFQKLFKEKIKLDPSLALGRVLKVHESFPHEKPPTL